MNEEYAEYLQSDAWKQKRLQRLSIAQFRCSACNNSKAVHVHHLTYERIFNEEMGDLLPLCEDHHKLAEELIRTGVLSRNGNTLFLATETVRLITGKPFKRPPKFDRKPIGNRFLKLEARNPTQCSLMQNEEFVADLLAANGTRKDFKKMIKRKITCSKGRSKIITNALVLFDRYGRGGTGRW